jgi:hypothetical protein
VSKIGLAALLLLLTAWPTMAGPKKVLTFFTRPFRDPLWDVGEFLNAAAIGTDAYSTVLRTNRQVETNRFLGRNPSRASVVGLATLSFSLQTTYHAACWHLTTGENDTKPWRIVGYTAIPTEVVIIYGYFGAVHNFQLEFPKLKAQDSMIQVKR